MNKDLDDIKDRWKSAKMNLETTTSSVDMIISQAEKKKQKSVYFQYGNIAILTATLVLIISFFYFVAPLQEPLSKIGKTLMVGGLAVRILIEIFSIRKSSKIDLGDNALQSTNSTLSYYQFRKQIHGAVTFTIVALYTVGFYILTPEFSKYIDLPWMIVIDTSYIVGAVFLVWQIRKGIRQEMKDLADMVALKKELTGEE